MIDLIKTIFENNEYVIKGDILPNFEVIEIGFLASLENEKIGKYNYYLVIQINDLKTFHAQSEKALFKDLFNYVKSLEIYKSYVEKNLSLLILWKPTSLDLEKLENKDRPLRQFISDIEENPYFFKKQVLCYTEQELKLLQDRLKGSDTTIIKKLQIELNDKSGFEELKTDKFNPTAYSLLSRVFIKLPFLEMEIKKSQLEPLSEKINQAIDGLTTFRDIIINSPSDDEQMISDLYAQIISDDK